MDKLRVLVVDDEEAMCKGVERALQRLKINLPDVDAEVAFTVASAQDGTQAWKQIDEQPPDILLLDHKLPDTNGLEVLNTLNEKEINLLTIVITAYASLETAVQATKQGAYDFLAKPFTPDEIRGAVRKAAKDILWKRQAEKLAEEKRNVRFQFTSVLAHEMKSPLGAVKSYLQVMKKRAKGEELSAYEQMIDRSLKRLDGMHQMIQDLLDMTAIESGQKTREFTTVNLNALASEIMETFSPQAAEQSITLEKNIAENLTIEADQAEMQMILNNLVSNAIKYNKENGHVSLTMNSYDSGIRIEVTDTGIGMTEAEEEKLFEDFSRIKNEKTRDILGSGLGLSTVRKLALLYDGDVEVQSLPDQGSAFTVFLKSAAPAQTEEAQQ